MRMKRRDFVGLTTVASLGTAYGGEKRDGEKPLLSFGLLTDVQYADANPQGERHYRESPAKLREAVGWLARKNLPFTLHLGDLIDRDFKSFDTVLPLFDGLGHPVHHLAGNHDFNVAGDEKARVAAKLGMPGDPYSFHASGVRFVMLDTNEVSVYKQPEGSAEALAAEAMLVKLQSAGAPGAKRWNGGVSAGQLEWLEALLASADAAGEPVIVCGHHPLLPAESHQVWNGPEVVAALDRHPCVRAYFNGHHHAGAEEVRNGVPYITFKSILHEPGVTAFSLIRLFPRRLEIVGMGREKSRSFELLDRP